MDRFESVIRVSHAGIEAGVEIKHSTSIIDTDTESWNTAALDKKGNVQLVCGRGCTGNREPDRARRGSECVACLRGSANFGGRLTAVPPSSCRGTTRIGFDGRARRSWGKLRRCAVEHAYLKYLCAIRRKLRFSVPAKCNQDKRKKSLLQKFHVNSARVWWRCCTWNRSGCR